MAEKQPELRFTQLKLTNWRNFRAVDIRLTSRAFFLGPNASGKSNLLDSLRFLAEIAYAGSGGLQAATRLREGFSAVRSRHARNPSWVELEVRIGTDAAEEWRYRLRLNTARGSRPVSVLEEEIVHRNEPLQRRVRSEHDKADEIAFSQTLLEQVSLNQGFRQLVDFLSSCRYLHVVPQIVRDRGRAKFEGDDPFGGDLLRRMKSMSKKMREPRLRRLAEALKIAVPQFDGLALDTDADGVPHLQASFSHWRAGATKQPETAFSDGTLRLIGLLWSITEQGGPLLLEEPELSLNDAVIRQLPKMFARMQRLSRRQVIMTTHSASLIDSIDLGGRDLHRIVVGGNGSTVETVADNKQLTAQMENGMTASEAILPLLQPDGVERLGTLDIAG